jgi:hypothetical protein
MKTRSPLGLWFLLFLLLPLSPPVWAATLGNFVWEDRDGDGRQDSTESGKPGMTVQLWNAAKTQILDSDITDASGNYTLTTPGTGEYRVRVVLPYSGDVFSPIDQAAGDNALDSDIFASGANQGFTDIITIIINTANLTSFDAGVISDPMRDHNIGDRVFRALPDGTQPSPGTGISGVTVQLLSTTDTVLQTTTSQDGGFYSFKAPPGTYRLKFLSPLSMAPSPHPNSGGDDENDSDIAPSTGLTSTFTLAAGQVRRNIDAGFVTIANLGNFVWDDLDKDGKQDAGEPGLPGITVQLWNAAKTQLVETTVTDAFGAYVLHGLGGEDYRIRAVLPYPGDVFSPKDQAGGDNQQDNDVNPAGPDTGFTDVFNITINTISISSLDIGVISDPMKDHNIGDRVFRADENGVQTGTGGISGIVVHLLSSTGQLLQTTTSSGNAGFYSFKAPPGTYRLKFFAPSYMTPSPHPNSGSDNDLDSDIFADGTTGLFTVTAGTVRRNMDAGLVQLVNIGNLVWNDLNADGLQDAGEPGLPNVALELWNAAKTERLDSTVTDAFGKYALYAPGGGYYRIWVLRPLPEDSFTTPNAGSSDQEDSDILTNPADFGFSDIFFIGPNVISTTTFDAGIRFGPGRRTMTPLEASLKKSGLAWSLTFTGPIGGTYLVERSPDLLTWTEVEAPFVSTLAKTAVPLDGVSGAAKLWWRVRRVK